jgi:hypothetical protein
MNDNKKYVCFSCLQESENPNVCTHCGAKIENLDLAVSKFIPPHKGVVSISKRVEVDDLFGIVEKSVEHISGLYHDVFKLTDGSKEILVECNDIAGTRLVDHLNKAFEQKGIDYKVSFYAT